VRQVRGYTGNNYTTITKARGIRYGFQGNTEQAKQSTGACVPRTTHRERERETDPMQQAQGGAGMAASAWRVTAPFP
jgi:hypothetical protein